MRWQKGRERQKHAETVTKKRERERGKKHVDQETDKYGKRKNKNRIQCRTRGV